ncbi:MAG: response regulator, partial [Muribaculaceae bacterium]|nr:response regulator [Muribaculaceae bacterium]
DNNESTAYTRESGLGVSEFSDGAGFATDESIFFGGVDGFVIVSHNHNEVDSTLTTYMPPIRLQRLNILGKNTSLAKHVTMNGYEPILTLDSHQNLFSVTFTAPDYINASNYTYYYAIDQTDDWVSNGNNRTITFNELGYGTYRLYLKYVNRMTGIESKPFLLYIKINAPWYLSTRAIVIYVVIIIALVIAFVYELMRRQKRRQMNELKLMRYTHREELYEEKLRFFTNITHEFSTPLTLIYGPCERLLNYPGADEYTKRYVGIIRTSAERLNNLIQELIEFRRIETGHKKLKIHPVDISTLCRDTLSAYEELAETNSIDLRSHIEDNIEWNSDFSSLRKVLNNLVSNAFKYTPVGGRIELDARTENGKMVLSVYNSGKGISDEHKATIFNRYAVLDNVEENAIKGLASRNGLGLAICYSIVEMLKGTIEIDSKVGEYARFIVTLPMLEANVSSETNAEKPQQMPSAPSQQPAAATAPPIAAGITEKSMPSRKTTQSNDKGKNTILVVDDNTEILSLLSDSLKDYNVLTATNAQEGTEIITRQMPDLIITDVMMPGIDGFEFTRNIKNNIHTSHLPMIILSAKNSVKEQVDGLKSGADVYIGKPFSLSYLNAVIKRLLDQRSSLKEYYTSSGSAFEYSNGKLMAREDSDLVSKATAFVEEHIEDSDLSPDTLAQYLQMSVRHLYRKFKDLEMPSPNDFIKDLRMAVVVKLLVTTQLNMQEIMYRTGFNNRSHFYREFSKRYDMTPSQYRSSHQQADNSLNTSHKNGGGKFQLRKTHGTHSIIVEE